MGGLATETSIQSLARTNRKGFRSQEETKARRHKRGDSAPCTQDPLFPLLQGAEATGALTHGSGFNIRVEESNDYVDEDSQVEGNASPESHSAGEPVHQRHACGERRQTHISANLVPAGKAVTSQTPKLSSAQPVRPLLHAIDKSFLLISCNRNTSSKCLCSHFVLSGPFDLPWHLGIRLASLITAPSSLSPTSYILTPFQTTVPLCLQPDSLSQRRHSQ